jgi:uncharacterized protein (UPF0332 family)
MSRENTLALVRYRLEQADDAMRAAHILLDQQLSRDAVNRAYYGMFYSVLALLVTKRLGTSKHQGAISLFDREFVRSGVFDRELSSWLHKAFDMRLSADYAERVGIPQEEAQNLLRQAETFVSRVKTHLSCVLDDPGLAENPGNAKS